MSSYTIIGKTVTCPCFNTRVTLSGKYLLKEDCSNPTKAVFQSATCPIVENSKLPYYDQCEEYKYFVCLKPNKECEHLSDFAKIITLH